MKFSKIFTIALAAVAFTACSDDDRTWNTAADVTVEMGQPSVTFKEGKEAVTFPVVVNGDANGDISVTFAVKESGANPAQEDVHYYLLTKTIVIYPEDKSYNVEMTVIDDDVINDPRTFQVEIVSAQGAAIGGQKFTDVTIKDNDADFYDKLSGKWKLNYKGGYVQVNLVAGDEETEAYNNYYLMEGLGEGLLTYQVFFVYDKETNTGHLELPYGQNGGTVNFSGLGAMDVYLGELVGESSITYRGGLIIEWNDTFTEMSMESTTEFENPSLILLLFQNGSFAGYSWKSYDGCINFTRK